MFFFYKKGRKRHKSKNKWASSDDYQDKKSKKSGITRAQMEAITETIMSKKRLVVYVE